MHDSTSVIYDELSASLPTEIAGALELLSVPHWVDDELAVDMMVKFGHTNGATVQALGEVKRLPFISPHGQRGWRVAEPARDHFHAHAEAKSDVYRQLNDYLAEQLLSGQLESKESPLAREATWRVIYHQTPGAPGAALASLESFVERADAVGRVTDMRAAASLTQTRHKWLGAYEVEVAYITGRYFYTSGDWRAAEARFVRVLESDSDPHRLIVCGHLLGVIWSSRGSEPWWTQATQTLRQAARLARDTKDWWGEAVTLTTLGTVLTRLGGGGQLEEAEEALRRSMELRARAGEEDGLALGALGAVLYRRGGRERLLEAERVLRRSREILPPEARTAVMDRLAQVLLRLGGSARLDEAEGLLRDRLRQASDDFDVAVTLNTLAAVLMKRGGKRELKEADEAIRQSIDLGRKNQNSRHVAMALLTASWIAERRGDKKGAIQRQQELININRELGLSREVAKGEERLRQLRTR